MANLTYAASVVVAGQPERLYELVSDITRMGEWSPVCTACWWDGDDTARVGAHFTGHNETPGRTWETRCKVVAADPGREFAFIVGASFVRWGYTFDPVEGGTQITESWEFLPAGIAMFEERFGADAKTEIDQRTEAAHAGIPATLAAIKRTAESG